MRKMRKVICCVCVCAGMTSLLLLSFVQILSTCFCWWWLGNFFLCQRDLSGIWGKQSMYWIDIFISYYNLSKHKLASSPTEKTEKKLRESIFYLSGATMTCFAQRYYIFWAVSGQSVSGNTTARSARVNFVYLDWIITLSRAMCCHICSLYFGSADY